VIATQYICKTCQLAFSPVRDGAESTTTLAEIQAHLEANKTHEILARIVWSEDQAEP
jgi:hypothetical protein